jgi:hypothetical protein
LNRVFFHLNHFICPAVLDTAAVGTRRFTFFNLLLNKPGASVTKNQDRYCQLSPYLSAQCGQNPKQ